MLVELGTVLVDTLGEPMKIKDKQGSEARDMCIRDILVRSILSVEVDSKKQKLNKVEMFKRGNLAKEIIDSETIELDKEQLTLLEDVVAQVENIWTATQIANLLAV